MGLCATMQPCLLELHCPLRLHRMPYPAPAEIRLFFLSDHIRPPNMTSHHSQTPSVPLVSSTLVISHVPIRPWTTVELLELVWCGPFANGLETSSWPTASHLASDRRVWPCTSQHWSSNRLSPSAESTGMEQARRNGNVRLWTSHMMMMMTPTVRRLAQWEVYMYVELSKNVFRWYLNVVVIERLSFNSVGSRFHARGVATENARSPNRCSVRGRKEVAIAGRAQRRAWWHVGDRCERVGGAWPINVLWCPNSIRSI